MAELPQRKLVGVDDVKKLSLMIQLFSGLSIYFGVHEANNTIGLLRLIQLSPFSTVAYGTLQRTLTPNKLSRLPPRTAHNPCNAPDYIRQLEGALLSFFIASSLLLCLCRNDQIAR